nr:MAG TPA: HeH/LEM domain [Caudoviricetes sp.]DAN64331.1 MAG TPA: HeH/LEM domain [Caudoviricetes sp.]DAN82407.1 MAG TPA: HeH/LEM domain [Caudoviricetes sp.]
MTKAQLLDYAGENGVDGVSSSMRKADIIAVLERS